MSRADDRDGKQVKTVSGGIKTTAQHRLAVLNALGWMIDVGDGSRRRWVTTGDINDARGHRIIELKYTLQPLAELVARTWELGVDHGKQLVIPSLKKEPTAPSKLVLDFNKDSKRYSLRKDSSMTLDFSGAPKHSPAWAYHTGRQNPGQWFANTSNVAKITFERGIWVDALKSPVLPPNDISRGQDTQWYWVTDGAGDMPKPGSADWANQIGLGDSSVFVRLSSWRPELSIHYERDGQWRDAQQQPSQDPLSYSSAETLFWVVEPNPVPQAATAEPVTGVVFTYDDEDETTIAKDAEAGFTPGSPLWAESLVLLHPDLAMRLNSWPRGRLIRLKEAKVPGCWVDQNGYAKAKPTATPCHHEAGQVCTDWVAVWWRSTGTSPHTQLTQSEIDALTPHTAGMPPAEAANQPAAPLPSPSPSTVHSALLGAVEIYGSSEWAEAIGRANPKNARLGRAQWGSFKYWIQCIDPEKNFWVDERGQEAKFTPASSISQVNDWFEVYIDDVTLTVKSAHVGSAEWAHEQGAKGMLITGDHGADFIRLVDGVWVGPSGQMTKSPAMVEALARRKIIWSAHPATTPASELTANLDDDAPVGSAKWADKMGRTNHGYLLRIEDWSPEHHIYCNAYPDGVTLWWNERDLKAFGPLEIEDTGKWVILDKSAGSAQWAENLVRNAPSNRFVIVKIEGDDDKLYRGMVSGKWVTRFGNAAYSPTQLEKAHGKQYRWVVLNNPPTAVNLPVNPKFCRCGAEIYAHGSNCCDRCIDAGLEQTFGSDAPEPVIHHPNYYQANIAGMNIEARDVSEAFGLNHSLASAAEYILRAGKKDPAEREKDIKKAIWHLRWEIGETRLTDAERFPADYELHKVKVQWTGGIIGVTRKKPLKTEP